MYCDFHQTSEAQVAKKQRRKLTADFKARVALAALREDKTLVCSINVGTLVV